MTVFDEKKFEHIFNGKSCQNFTYVFSRQILKLLNVTCGFEDPAEADSSQNDGYIFLLNLCDNETEVESEKVTWDGEIVHVSPTVDTSIALANLQVQL